MGSSLFLIRGFARGSQQREADQGDSQQQLGIFHLPSSRQRVVKNKCTRRAEILAHSWTQHGITQAGAPPMRPA
jgi:hypothetical protein